MLASVAVAPTTRPEPESVRSDCLDVMTLAALADRHGSSALRASDAAHLIECAHCRRALVSLGTLLDESVVADAVRQSELRPRTVHRARTAALVGVGAAAIALAAVLSRGLAHRASPETLPVPTVAAPAVQTPHDVTRSAASTCMRPATIASCK